jgi:microcystin-dependent protein
MSDPYIGEIRMFGGNFAPAGWAFCAGQLMAIAENDALFTLIGTTYGGDGQETFGIPDLQGRVPLHQGSLGGNTYTIGEKAGVESVTINNNTMTTHNHLVATTGGTANANVPSSATILADEGPASATVKAYLPFAASNQVTLRNTAVGGTGGSQPHENMQPFLAISFIISLFGIFPSQT